jgi:hypothetical protein
MLICFVLWPHACHDFWTAFAPRHAGAAPQKLVYRPSVAMPSLRQHEEEKRPVHLPSFPRADSSTHSYPLYSSSGSPAASFSHTSTEHPQWQRYRALHQVSLHWRAVQTHYDSFTVTSGTLQACLKSPQRRSTQSFASSISSTKVVERMRQSIPASKPTCIAVRKNVKLVQRKSVLLQRR